MLIQCVGLVIRINPDDLHFNDPDFHDEIFTSSRGKVEKPFKEANCYGPYPAVYPLPPPPPANRPFLPPLPHLLLPPSPPPLGNQWSCINYYFAPSTRQLAPLITTCIVSDAQH